MALHEVFFFFFWGGGGILKKLVLFTVNCQLKFKFLSPSKCSYDFEYVVSKTHISHRYFNYSLHQNRITQNLMLQDVFDYDMSILVQVMTLCRQALWLWTRHHKIKKWKMGCLCFISQRKLTVLPWDYTVPCNICLKVLIVLRRSMKYSSCHPYKCSCPQWAVCYVTENTLHNLFPW